MRVLAFDSDVLIYAAQPGHPLGKKVLSVLTDAIPEQRCVGSLLLLPELLSKPLGQRSDASDASDAEVRNLRFCLSHLELVPMDEPVATLATSLGASYRLRAPDAIHLATAVHVGATAFVTNNRKDFSGEVLELSILYPDVL